MKTSTTNSMLIGLFMKNKNVIPQYFKNYIFIFTFFIMGCIPIHTDHEKIIIPIDLSLNRPVIKLFINNKGPYKFIFDTGASGNVIDTELADNLGLKETGKIEVGTPGSEITSLVTKVNVPGIVVSGKKFSNISMVKMNLRNMLPVDGILSFSEFSEYLININYPDKKIILEKGALQKDKESVISLTPDSEILTIQLEANGRKWNTHLDTGSPFLFSFPLSSKDNLKFKSPPVLVSGQSRTLNGSHKNWKAVLKGNIKLGNIIYNSPEVILSEITDERVNIGYQLLKDLSITIDTKNMLIKFEKVEVKDTVGTKETKINGDVGIVGRYGGVRSITCEDGVLYIQRDGSIKLELRKINDNLYQGQLPEGMKAINVLPNIRFERDSNKQVIGLTFINKDGKEDFVKKDDVLTD